MFASWKESSDKPRQHIEKQTHQFANKGPYSQNYGFSSSKYGCECWTIKKAEHWRIYAFELWCWRRLLRGPWTAKRSNQSIQGKKTLMSRLNKKDPKYWERWKAEGEGDDRGQDGCVTSPTLWTWVWASSGRWWRARKPGVLQSMGLQRVGHDWVTEQQHIVICVHQYGTIQSTFLGSKHPLCSIYSSLPYNP